MKYPISRGATTLVEKVVAVQCFLPPPRFRRSYGECSCVEIFLTLLRNFRDDSIKIGSSLFVLLVIITTFVIN